MQPKAITLGARLVLKKDHACKKGAKEFVVKRLGSDILIECCSCLHDITIPRIKLEKSIKEIIPQDISQNTGDKPNV